MTFDTWLYYFLAVLVLTASPGPSVLLCLSKSVTQGFRSAVFTALGSLLAILGIMSLSFTGLGVLIASSELLFNIIKWLGCAYLVYLGYLALMSKQESFQLGNQSPNVARQSRLSLFSSGFIVGASNPKAIVFFTALFPQFIDTTEPMLLQYLAFTVTFAVLEMTWLLAYAVMGAKSSGWLMQKGRAKVFNRITGGVFVSAGLLLATSRTT